MLMEAASINWGGFFYVLNESPIGLTLMNVIYLLFVMNMNWRENLILRS